MDSTQANRPGPQAILDMATGYQGACIIGAAAELDLWTVIGERSLSAEEITAALCADLRATRILLDAVVALGLLDKKDDCYSVAPALRPMLSDGSPQSLLPMLHHRMNLVRTWSQLAWIVKGGILPPSQASIRGFDADRASFIAAMHVASGPVAAQVVAKMQPLNFDRVLDVGGASGTWTIALLEAVAGAKATIFDLPDAIRQARARFAAGPLADRVDFAAGDFYRDEFPPGADFAWISAIIHQHAREDSRALFAKAYRALVPGGMVAIRDFVMEPSRTRPIGGAMFAVNMLANTERGATFTFEETAADLQSAGFRDPQLRVPSEDMSAVIVARKAE